MFVVDKQVSFKTQWDDSRYVDPSSVRITNIKYSNLSDYELNKIDVAAISNDINVQIASSKAREKSMAVLRLNPIVKQNGQFKKITSFTVNYGYTTNREQSKMLSITNSVLATGAWFKFKVEETGVHRISRSFLEDLGMNVSGINPANIKVYGHGGETLSLLNEQNNEFDLPETAIKVIGGEDGSFDSSDAILFYGTSTRGYSVENDSHINPYDDNSYYYITASGGPGLRVQELQEPSGGANEQINTFTDSQFHEEDEYTPAYVGRRWYGNRFDIESDQTYTFDVLNPVPGSDTEIIIRAGAISESATSLAVTVNGVSVDPIQFGATNDTQLLSDRDVDFVIPSTGQVVVNMTYNNAGNPSSKAYLDYIRVVSQRILQGGNGQFGFSKAGVELLSGIGQYTISNATEISEVWDVTERNNIRSKVNTEGAGSFTFKSLLGSKRKYVAVDAGDYLSPVMISNKTVSNQNLKGTLLRGSDGNFSDVDYLIVAPPYLLQPALRLAAHHKNVNGLEVKVVSVDKIYEEFSSGKQDISAIRNMVRYVYENASSEANRVKYLCLFGDNSIDNKDRLTDNINPLPIFHTLSSTSTVSSFMSDDFYGSMDINEGTIGGKTIDENGVLRNDVDLLDIAVGRILADDVLLANSLVDKIIAYESKASYGNWRNNFTLISDDVDEFYEFQSLQVNLDELGDEIESQKPFINVKKIHSDAFEQQSSAGGDRYPAVNAAIVENIEVGSLIVNYFGHGGEDGLAKEFIVTRDAAQNFKNENRFPCVITVTCEFTKFDNPERTTAGELVYWNPDGGAISLVTTTRSVTVSLGVEFNQEMAAQLFGFGTNDVSTPAEALRVSKNNIDNDLRRVIFYIGDPAMHLAFPKQRINITTLNDEPIESSTTVLQALSKVKLGGNITDENGTLLSTYNGVLEAKLFDKDVQRTTLGNDGVKGTDGALLVFDFKVLGSGIFNGQATVTNGKFEFEFVVPRDIQLPVGAGRLSLYAQKDNVLEDQTGYSLDLKIGGLNENAPEDNIGPEILLFMNDESFVSGGITNASPNLIAKLSDANGINTASGIGHDMIAILDGDESNPFVLNEFYQAAVDDYTNGETFYKFRDLEDGLHTLTFKAWDVYNNSTTAEIQFVVAGDDVLRLDRVLNYPNPFVSYTEFWFEHNRPGEPLDVQVQIFTVTGKIVKTINQQVVTPGSQSRDIVWDGRDDFGDKIGKGVYVYKISVKSTLNNKRVEKYEKLVIL
ncbi:hypothetical protein SCB49_04325 [unidentified eubacterium SCB49]|nr:hypothetical protein SCB49_04325 [unidentified eubacterium SCB49]